MAAKTANAIFAWHETFHDARDYYIDIKRRAASYGRSNDQPLVFPGIVPIIGSTEREAAHKYEELAALVNIDDALIQLGRPFNYYDFSKSGLDEPFPDLGDFGSNSTRSYTDRVKHIARDEGLTLRQTALRFATPRGDFVGTPEKIADIAQRWFEEGAADGFIITTGLGDTLNAFFEHVIPILQKRGLFRTSYEHATLRGNLGLPFAVNRHAQQQPLAAE